MLRDNERGQSPQLPTWRIPTRPIGLSINIVKHKYCACVQLPSAIQPEARWDKSDPCWVTLGELLSLSVTLGELLGIPYVKQGKT